MLFISFDQATNTTGYSVFHNTELVKYGKFNKTGENEFYKFAEQSKEICLLIDNMKKLYPKEKIKISLEDIQMQANVQTFKTLARLQGALGTILLMNYPEIELNFVFSSTWKSFSKIKGKARAEQKRNAQKLIFDKYNKKVTQDEADAILIGYYSSHKEVNWE